MEVPIVTAEHVRQLRAGYPHADLVYAGEGRMLVRLAHDGVVEGEHLYSSQRLDSWRPADAKAPPLDDAEQAARLTATLTPIIEELVAKERAEQIAAALNSYAGDDVWSDLIEKLPDFDRRLPQNYPDYVRSAYDQRHHDATATTAEFVGLDERVMFSLNRRDKTWHFQYTKEG